MTCAIDGIKGLEGMCLCVSVLLSCQKGELWYCNVRNVPKSPVMPTCYSGSLALHRGHLKFRLPTRLHLNDITPTLSTVTFIYFLPKGNAPSDIPPCDFQTSWCYFITSRWMLVFLPYVDIVLISVDSWLPSSMSKSKFVPYPLCSHLCVLPPRPFFFCCCSVSRALPGLLGFYFWHAACGCVRVIQGPDSRRSLTVTLASFHIIFYFNGNNYGSLPLTRQVFKAPYFTQQQLSLGLPSEGFAEPLRSQNVLKSCCTFFLKPGGWTRLQIWTDGLNVKPSALPFWAAAASSVQPARG